MKTPTSKPSPLIRRALCASACESIRAAIADLREAGASNAADYCARALKSAQGAERHAHGRVIRAEMNAK